MDKPRQTDYVKVYRLVSESIVCNIIEKDLFSPAGFKFIKTEDDMDVWYECKLVN